MSSAKWWPFCLSFNVLIYCGLVVQNGDIDLGLWVNTGSGNGLLPDGTKPIPEPVSSYHQWSLVAFTLQWFHRKCSRYQLVKSLPYFPGYIEFNALWSSNTIWWHGTGSTLVQIMACCLSAPNHYLNQCWLIISEALRHSLEGIFMRNAPDIYFLYEIYQIKITAASPRGQWVKQ